ncbi:MAG: hypothetical protein II961_09350 [Candidatus Riflebacteria bacterium]|nr:hypothetical protein [Candidatus Riflebacteria bacterium]
MRLKRQTNSKKGIAVFFVLFTLIILGILVVQFHVSSRNAQSAVHRFQTSEMARQIAAAAQEEAFKYLYDKTDNPNSKSYDDLDGSSILRKIIDRTSIYAPDFKRTSSNCIKIDIPATVKMAENIMGDRMDITAEARIVDFRNCNYQGNVFYKNEGIGTIEIVTTAKAKEKYKKNFPGACTIVRHHDYKVVSLLSKKERDENYAGNRVLDYALFIRQGQNEFLGNSSDLGFSLNPDKKVQLEINAGSGSTLGKVHFGTDHDHYTFLNLSDKTKDFIPNGNKVIDLLEAEDQDVDKFLPSFRAGIIASYTGLYLGDDCTVTSVNSITGHKALFKHQKLPITDEHINTDTLKNERNTSSKNAVEKQHLFVTNNNYNYFDGIKINPKERLDEILDSDIRKQFFNYGYFLVDLSKCVINVTVKKDMPWPLDDIIESKDLYVIKESPQTVKDTLKTPVICYNYNYSAIFNSNEYKTNIKPKINYEELYNFIKTHDDNQTPSIASRAFTFINNEYSYQLKDEPPIISQDDFHNREYIGNSRPYEAQYPFAHFNLFNKRYVNDVNKLEELQELGILEKNKLKLRGIIHCSSDVVLGENGDITVEGSGVLIARNINIKGAIKKANKDSVVVLFARNGNVIINTSKTIEAALISMKGPDGSGLNMGSDGRIVVNDKLDLKGSLAVDYLNIKQWKETDSHKITYDEALAPTRDVYQVNIANWVTFERVIENE